MMRATAGDDCGYCLAELLVATAVVGMIGAALFGVYHTSVQAHARTTSLHDAQTGVRAGLDRMATDLRLIGAYWTGAAGAGPAILAAGPTSITFMGDVNGDTVHDGVETTITDAVSAGAFTLGVSGTAREAADAFNVYVNSSLNDFVYIGHGATREVAQVAVLAGTTITLATPLANGYPRGSVVRSVERVTYAFDPVARKLTRASGGSGADTIVDAVTRLTLTFYDGSHPPASPTDPAQTTEIHVKLTVQGPSGGHRTMGSRVRLRNR